MSIHSFAKSLAKGKLGEDLLNEVWPTLRRLDGRKADFVDTISGLRIELKSDSYNMEKTPNFFIEIWSDIDRHKVGGPWQALEHGSDLWIYMFQANRTMFIFEVATLVATLEKLVDEYPRIEIPNKSWTTIGVKVPRERLSHIYEKREF